MSGIDDNQVHAGHTASPDTDSGLLLSVAAAAAVLLAGLHFWPFGDSRIWQLLGPTNAALALGFACLALDAAKSRSLSPLLRHLPDGAWAGYVMIAIFSTTFAPQPMRAAFFGAKLLLVAVAGYAVLKATACKRGGVRLLWRAAVGAWLLATVACLASRLSGHGGCGFFGNAHKYGSFTGALTPLVVVPMLLSNQVRHRVLGSALSALAVLSAPTTGCLAAVAAGLAAAFSATRGSRRRGTVATTAAACALVLASAWHTPVTAPLRQDLQLHETEGTDLKQRYIEWQALVNMLEDRAVGGCGAGCMNVYRSQYYGRLPKLNTLNQYDQNGWLTMAGESGLLCAGLFCLAIVSQARLAWQAARRTPNPVRHGWSVACLASLVAAGVANLFSSLLFNGILVVLVTVLALASGASECSDA
jgi:hypothetical protein